MGIPGDVGPPGTPGIEGPQGEMGLNGLLVSTRVFRQNIVFFKNYYFLPPMSLDTSSFETVFHVIRVESI